MGKARKKKGKTDFDALLADASKVEQDAGGWQSGVSAMMLDADEYGADGAGSAAAAAAGGDMDTTEAQPKIRKTVVGVQKLSMKRAVRGNRTLNQKKRKAAKAEKALARAEKETVRLAQGSSKKVLKATLKKLY